MRGGDGVLLAPGLGSITLRGGRRGLLVSLARRTRNTEREGREGWLISCARRTRTPDPSNS